MGAHLRREGGFLGRADAPGAPGARLGTVRPGLLALATPAAKRGWIDPVHRRDVSHSMAGIHRGQGSLTDVIGGVRALHRPTLADEHFI